MPPVIMVHGSSSYRGVSRVDTGRPRRLVSDFVRKGVSTYLVDQAGRGRSGFDESVINEAAAIAKAGDPARPQPRFRVWRGSPTTAHGPLGSAIWCRRFYGSQRHIHTPRRSRRPSGCQPPWQRLSSRVPPLRRRSESSRAQRAIGPAPAAPTIMTGAQYYKQLVPNTEATLPGSTCKTCEPKQIAPANTWTPQDLARTWWKSWAARSW